jgi:DNA-binding response OmpR family regulator
VPRILVVEDQAPIARILTRALGSGRWEVDVVKGATVDPAAGGSNLDGGYSLVLLSLPLRGMDGGCLLQRIMSADPDQMVIVVSDATDPERTVPFLDAGAVDYVCRPYSIEEIVARIQLRLRPPMPNEPETERRLSRGGVTLDLWRRHADAGKGEVSLTEREFVLLGYLMTHEGDVFTRDALLSELWGISPDSGSNLVECYIAKLRAKLGGDVIDTVWKRGYAFVGLYEASGLRVDH